MLSRLLRVAGATVVALAALFAAPAFANVKTVNNISVETSLTQITRGQPYSYQITPSGPSGYSGSYTFSVIGGSLPTGISVSSSGLVSGVTCDANGSNKFDLRISTTGAPATTADFSGNSNGMSVNVTTSGAGVCDLTMTGSAPNGTVGTVYAGGSFAVSGGTSPYTYDLFSGTLPPGLTLNSNGTLTGTPTTAGTYTFVVRGRDTILRSGMATYTVTISPAAPVTLTVNPTTLPGGQTTVAYSQSFSVSNGTSPYTYLVSAGSLPSGLTLSTGGTLSGTPTVAATYNFTVQATDSVGNTGTRAYTVDISGSNTLTIAPTSLPNGAKSSAYSQALTASGGTGPFNWSITAGALPAGIAIDMTTGALTGTPTVANTFNFTVRALDANGNFGTRAYTVVIAAATITIAPASLSNASNGAPYNQAITASGGTGPYTYSLGVGSALPLGMSFSSGGTLIGTPIASGSYNITVIATDSLGDTGSRAYTLVVDPANIVLSPSSLPNVATGAPVNTTFTATGGTGPYTYASSGTLPPGLALSTGGTLSGTPTVPGTYTFDITVTDAHGDTKTVSFSFTIDALPLSIDPPTLPNAKNGMAYTESFIGGGGVTPYTFALDSGALPNGLTLASDGTLSGTPAATAGNYNFTIRLDDAVLGSTTRSYTLLVESASMGIAPASLPDATTGVAYSQQLFTTGGAGPYTYSFTGTLPTGLALSTSGLVSGTPTAAGTYAFDVTATDSNGDTAFKSYSITVAFATVSVDPATLPDGTNGTAYSATFTASGGSAPYTYAISGSAPAGLALAGDTLSGTPAGAGSYTFTITATDNFGATGSRSYTVSVASATLVVSPSSLPGATNGVAYSQALSTSGGTAPYSYVSTTLPSGLTLSSAGVLSGMPNVAAGSYSFDVTVTDDNGDSTTVAYALVINAATIDVTPASLPGGTNGAAYNEAFAANGGTSPYTYAHVAGTLPSGLMFNGTALAGTPTAAGSYNFSIEATDANGDKGTRAYTVAILPATIDITPATLPNAANGVAYSLALTATGGTGPYTYALTSGTCPAGMTLSQAGLLSGTPGVAAGSFDIEVTATDGNGDNVTRAYTLVVGAATITVTPATLPGSSNGQPYSQDFAATGGTAPYTYALVAGTLPNGLALANGKLAGTPSAAGDYAFTVEATDANGDKGTRAYAVAIAAATIAIAPDALADGTNGTAFSQAFTATGGTAPYTFALASGTLPMGLALAANGTLAGTPTATGDFTFTVEATDANGDTASHAYTMAIAGGDLLTVNPETLPGGNAEEAYAQTLSAIGGNGPYTFAVTEGALPEGLALAADGKLTGTPTDAGDTTFTVTATDADGNFGTRAYTLVFAESIVLDITPGTLTEGRGGSPYEANFGATGGTAPYTFTVADGTLPPGMTLSSDGTLSGTPTTPGSYTFTVRGEDNLGHAGTRSFTLVVGAALRADPTRDPGVIDSVNEQLNAARRLGELQMSHVFRRIDAPRAPCTAAEGESSESCKTPVEVWATGTRETSFASGLAVVNAFTVGADMQAGPVRIGAALGTGSDLTERASGYRGDVDGKTWMLYGRIALGDTFGLSAVAGRTDVDIDSRRVLTDAGVALGRRDGDTEFVGVEVSGEWSNGDRGLVPYLRWEHARTELGGYAEAANSPLALQFAGVSQRNSAFVLGAEAFHVLRFNWGTLTPKVRVEVRDRDGSSVGQALWYSDAPGTPYVLSVRGVDDRSALAALGLEAAFGAVKVSLEYGTAGSAEDLFEGQAVRLQLRADF